MKLYIHSDARGDAEDGQFLKFLAFGPGRDRTPELLYLFSRNVTHASIFENLKPQGTFIGAGRISPAGLRLGSDDAFEFSAPSMKMLVGYDRPAEGSTGSIQLEIIDAVQRLLASGDYGTF